MKKKETLAHGYSSEVTQRGLSNEYQHDRVLMVFNNLGVLMFLTEVALAFEGLMGHGQRHCSVYLDLVGTSIRRWWVGKIKEGGGGGCSQGKLTALGVVTPEALRIL